MDPRISTYPHAQGAWLPLRSLRPWEMLTRALAVEASADRFARFLRDRSFDLVHLNSLVQVPAALGARRAGIPVVWHIREELHPGYLGVRRAWIRRCVERCATRAIVISRYNAAQLRPGPRTSVVYNFLDFGAFDRGKSAEVARAGLGIGPDVRVVLMLGGMVPSKGADVLVDAALRLRATRPDVLFLIAGLPPGGESPSFVKRSLRRLLEGSGLVPSVERRVQDTIRRHRLENTVRLVGLRRDVPELLASCTLLVWPATVSHFARPIIEAGAMGKPVVASDFPSSRELVDPGATGLLVPPGDPRALASAITELLDDQDKARRMGEAGHSAALRRFDARVNARAIIAVYDDLFASRPGGTRS